MSESVEVGSTVETGSTPEAATLESVVAAAKVDRGLYRKYDVQRVDGKDGPGGPHHNCRLFVLDLDHDRHARAAAAAYAESCKEQYPVLSRDLRCLSMSPGERAWDAYSEKVGRTTFDGKPLPEWAELGERQRLGWEAAANAAFETVVIRMDPTP